MAYVILAHLVVKYKETLIIFTAKSKILNYLGILT